MGFIYGYENGATILLMIASIIVVLVAQSRLKKTYAKYKKIVIKEKLSGQEVARMILDKNGLNNIHVVKISGKLTDHYDPKLKVVRLSQEVFDNETIASISIAAHEVGHAIQDKENYQPMRVRAALVPFVNLVSKLGYFVIIISIIAGISGYISIGILLIISTLIFQLVTLPVEFDASKRALKEINTLNIVTKKELEGSEHVLRAAALTYVAAVVSSIINLIRLVLMSNRD